MRPISWTDASRASLLIVHARPGAGSCTGPARVLLVAVGLVVLAASRSPARAQGAVREDGIMAGPQMPRPGSSRTFEAPRWRFNFAAARRFEAANTSHDGHLTQAQAEAAHMRGVGTHFAEIDSHHRGYVTFEELNSWRAERKVARENPSN